MLVKVKALDNGFHRQYQKKGSEFFYDAREDGGKPVLGKWMGLIEIVKKKKAKKVKEETKAE